MNPIEAFYRGTGQTLSRASYSEINGWDFAKLGKALTSRRHFGPTGMPEQVESAMSQLRFSEAEYAGEGKKTRREVFLGEMDQVLGAERVLTHRADWRVTRLW